MAEIDDRAFSALRKGAPDKRIFDEGGAIEYSEYEMDMTSRQQEKYLEKNARLFKRLYDTDPNVDRKKLPYKSYLENLDVELIRMRADDYDKQTVGKDDLPSPHYVAARDVDRLSRRHYGDIDRLRNMALGKGYPLY